MMLNSVMDIEKASWSQQNTPSLVARSMFYFVQSAGHFYCGSNYKTDRRNYNSMLLLYTTAGTGFLHYRGESYNLKQGKGFLINCMEKHYYGTAREVPWEFIWLHFNGSESKNYLEQIYENSGPVFTIKTKNIISDKIKEIHKLLKEGDPRLDITASSLIVDLLTELLLMSQSESEINDLPEPVKNVLEYIEGSFYQDISLDEIVKNVGVSKYHLSRLFKKHTGYSPYEYLINYRLNQAKDLLKSTQVPICKIGEKVGFNSTSHFIKIFRQHEETTPLQFRKYWR